MKKFLWVLVAVVCLSPSFADEKKDDHASSEKKVETPAKKGSERSEGESSGKGELAKKIDACLKDRPATSAKK